MLPTAIIRVAIENCVSTRCNPFDTNSATKKEYNRIKGRNFPVCIFFNEVSPHVNTTASAGITKSAAGVYGLLAVGALAVEPFLKIGAQYLMLKMTAAVCGVFAPKETAGLINNFSSAMGFLLAMTGSVCLMLLISVVCFMKGVS